MISYNPFDPAVAENPYPYYRQLRDEAPLYEVPALGAFAVSRHADVSAVMRDASTFSSSAVHSVLGSGRAPDAELLTADEREYYATPLMIASDAPKHTQMRTLVSRGFTPRRIARLEDRIRQVTTGLLDSVDPEDVDVIESLAVPLPVVVIAEMLGVDSSMVSEFRRWSDAVIDGISGTTDEGRNAALEPTRQLHNHIAEIAEDRKKYPREDLISVLVKAEGQHEVLNSYELLGFVTLLLVAGNETTRNLIANTICALSEHPKQLQRVVEDRSLISNLVEEGLRYDSPFQAFVRTATRDVDFYGITVPEGALIMPIWASANRDERQFENPDEFDVGRDCRGHIAFGLGAHFCLGASLARLEARVVFEELLTRFSRFDRLHHELTHSPSWAVRALTSLHIRAVPKSSELNLQHN